MDEPYELTMDSLPQFILGGVAEFVISEIGTKNHIRFKVKRDSKDLEKYWVRYAVLGDWIYIGWIEAKDKPIFHPLTLNINTPNETIIKADVFRKFILFVYHLLKLPKNIQVLYTGRCSICGRMLKDPIYIKIGIGKICLQKAIDNEQN